MGENLSKKSKNFNILHADGLEEEVSERFLSTQKIMCTPATQDENKSILKSKKGSRRTSKRVKVEEKSKRPSLMLGDELKMTVNVLHHKQEDHFIEVECQTEDVIVAKSDK